MCNVLKGVTDKKRYITLFLLVTPFSETFIFNIIKKKILQKSTISFSYIVYNILQI